MKADSETNKDTKIIKVLRQWSEEKISLSYKLVQRVDPIRDLYRGRLAYLKWQTEKVVRLLTSESCIEHYVEIGNIQRHCLIHARRFDRELRKVKKVEVRSRNR